MMEHRERRRTTESRCVELQLGGVTDDDVDIGALETIGETCRQSAVDLDSSQARHPLTQHLRRCSEAWPDLDDVVAEIDVGEYPRHDQIAHGGAPLLARASVVMFAIHTADGTERRPRPTANCGAAHCATRSPSGQDGVDRGQMAPRSRVPVDAQCRRRADDLGEQLVGEVPVEDPLVERQVTVAESFDHRRLDLTDLHTDVALEVELAEEGGRVELRFAVRPSIEVDESEVTVAVYEPLVLVGTAMDRYSAWIGQVRRSVGKPSQACADLGGEVGNSAGETTCAALHAGDLVLAGRAA